MRVQGLTRATPADAHEIELDEELWRSTRIVRTKTPPKTPVHLRIDPETLAFFRAAGKGHLTRMAGVLRAYAQSHRTPSEPVER